MLLISGIMPGKRQMKNQATQLHFDGISAEKNGENPELSHLLYYTTFCVKSQVNIRKHSQCYNTNMWIIHFRIIANVPGFVK